MMGSGKSHWAGRLGHHYGLPAYDLDRLLETAAGKTIRQIFDADGEDVFRKLESNLLQNDVPGKKYVLACGGGTPCFFDNMAFMKSHGIVVWLNPSIDELVRRVGRAVDTRPVLEGHQTPEALKDHLEKLMIKRASWYRQAHIEINDDASVQNITDKISLFESSRDDF